MAFERISRPTFFGLSALLFAASTVITIVWSLSMSSMKDMQMPGGWSMSMTWMPGQDWSGAALSFLGMWIVMMISMMMPSLMPMLLKYRQVIATKSNGSLDGLSMLVGAGYFFVWTVFGIAIFPMGVALTTAEMQLPALSHAVPVAIGIVILFAGLLQFTRWKSYQLTCCRQAEVCIRKISVSAGSAWLQGMRFGLHCIQCCFGLMIILLVVGVMDLRMMAFVTAAITAERLAPAGVRVSQITGVLAVGAGLLLIVRALL